MGRFSRTKLIFGEKGMAKLADASVLVVGIGGVGGYVCEMLARSGIGKLTLVDFDVVTQSNIRHSQTLINKQKWSLSAPSGGFGWITLTL